MNMFLRENNENVSSALLASRGGDPMVLKSVRANGAVTGLLFELAVEQHYVNPSDSNIEAVYTFPLPWGAVLLGMDVTLGEKTLHGVVVARDQAEEGYEAAIDNGDTAIMLERAADGLYTVNLGNLMAKEEAFIRYRYAQLLGFEQGHVRIAVPTVIAPRYGNAMDAGIQQHQLPSHDLRADYPFDISIVLRGEIGTGRITSSSHVLDCRHGSDQVEVCLAQKGCLDRDFVLAIDGLVGKSLTAVGQDGAGTVVLASFCPSVGEHPIAAPLALKILVDCSGSMAGDSIAGARRALHEILKHLTPEDRFSFSRFGDGIVHHTPSLVAATTRAIRHASGWVSATEANLGGTCMGSALLSIYAVDKPLPADILLITDGEVWETDQLIADGRHAGQRIFAVGIGSAPADSLLRSLARETGGACEFIGPNEDVVAAILRMFMRMRLAPVTELAVQWDTPVSWQSRMDAAVFSDQTMHVFACFPGEVPLSATMLWRQPEDNASHEATITMDAKQWQGDTLARVAAAMRLKDVAKSEREALALHYQLVTECTNLLIIHQRQAAEKTQSLPQIRKIAQMAAAGWGGAGTVMRHAASFDSLKAPALWRRESSSAHIRSPEANHEYDIPQFLRKAVDQVEVYPNRDALVCYLRAVDSGVNLSLNGFKGLLGSFSQLSGQIPEAMLDALVALRAAGHLETDIVKAFHSALIPLATEAGVSKSLMMLLQSIAVEVAKHAPLYDLVCEMLARSLAEIAAVKPVVPELNSPRISWRQRFSLRAWLSKQAD